MRPATLRTLRIGVLAGWALYIGYQAIRHGLDRWTFGVVGLGAIWGSSFYLIDARLSRPAKTYAYLALASSMVAALFIGLPATEHGDLTIGTIGWAGMTFLALIWCIYYERTTPR